jgi:TonB family protein
MRIFPSVLFLLSIGLTTTSASPAGREKEIQAADLLAHALELEDVRIAGLPAMNLKARLEVAVAKGDVATGDYILAWVSPSQSREEINFANVQRIRVQTTNGYWQKRNLGFQPEIIFKLDTLLNSKSLLRLGTNETLGKVGAKKQGGTRLMCVDVRQGTTLNRELCFDPTNGLLVAAHFPTGANQNPAEISRIEYSDFASWEGKMFPRSIRAFKDDKFEVGVINSQLARLANVDSALFKAPQDAEFWAGCQDLDKVQAAVLENRVQPQYPSKARANRVHGRVIFYAIVEADGTLSHLTIIHPADRDLEAAAIQAVRQWHYKPTNCNNTPVRAETSISVDFWLEQ